MSASAERRTIADLTTRRAIVYGAIAFVAAAALVFVQLTVAQVEGIDQNLGTIQQRIGVSYETLSQVVGKSAPTTTMADQVGQIVDDQAAIATTMKTLNTTLGSMQMSTDALAATTAGMVRTNEGVQRSIAAMSGDIRALSGTISGLIPVSRATGSKLGAMRRDSKATKKALTSIVNKMLGYGLPQAAP